MPGESWYIVAVQSSNRVAWLYTDDEGNTWRVAALAARVAQQVDGSPILGGSAAAATDNQKAFSGPLRRVSVNDGAGHSRVMVVYTKDAPITTATQTLTFNANVAGVITQVSGTGGPRILPEGRRPNVTKQTS